MARATRGRTMGSGGDEHIAGSAGSRNWPSKGPPLNPPTPTTHRPLNEPSVAGEERLGLGWVSGGEMGASAWW